MRDLPPWFVLGAVLFPAISSAQQEVRTQRQNEHEPLRYLFYSPAGDEDDAGNMYPLVLFLHGGGEGGSEIETVKKHGLPKLIEAGKEFPFYVVSPQNPSETRFWDDQQLIRLIDEVIENHPIDESRVYLTGLSRGGYPWVALGSLRAHQLTHGYLLRPLHGLKWRSNTIDVPCGLATLRRATGSSAVSNTIDIRPNVPARLGQTSRHSATPK
jgi:acetyl esterase/lipase